MSGRLDGEVILVYSAYTPGWVTSADWLPVQLLWDAAFAGKTFWEVFSISRSHCLNILFPIIFFLFKYTTWTLSFTREEPRRATEVRISAYSASIRNHRCEPWWCTSLLEMLLWNQDVLRKGMMTSSWKWKDASCQVRYLKLQGEPVRLWFHLCTQIIAAAPQLGSLHHKCAKRIISLDYMPRENEKMD